MASVVETSRREAMRWVALKVVAGRQLHQHLDPLSLRDISRKLEEKYVFAEELWPARHSSSGRGAVWTATTGVAFITSHQDCISFGHTQVKRVNWLRSELRDSLREADTGVIGGDQEMIVQMAQNGLVDTGKLDLVLTPSAGTRFLLALAYKDIYKAGPNPDLLLSSGIYFGLLPPRPQL